MKRTLIAFFLTVAFVGLLTWFRVIGFTYPVWEDNDCLNHPVGVVSIKDQIWTLSDGRLLKLDEPIDSKEKLTKKLAYSHDQVEIETDGDSQYCALWVNESHTRCGTPWAVGLRIPLFPVKLKGNSRGILAFAEILQPQPDDQK